MHAQARAVSLAAVTLALLALPAMAQAPSPAPSATKLPPSAPRTAGEPAFSSPTSVPPAPVSPAQAKAVPAPVLAAFHAFYQPNTKREKVRSLLAGVESELFGGKDVMTNETIAAYGVRYTATVRAQRLASVMAADLDGDGKVTRAELVEYLSVRPGMTRQAIDDSVSKILAMAKDKTSVTFEDLRTAPLPNVSNNAQRRLGTAVLGDAKSVTHEQFAKVALEAFDAMDENHDGTIQVNEYMVGQPQAKLMPGTPMPSGASGGSPSFTPGGPATPKPPVPSPSTPAGK